MKVCFVYPDIGGAERYGARKYYHGVGYLASVLRQAGHECHLIYLDHAPDEEEFLHEVSVFAPQLVAFSATTHQYPYVERCARWTKQVMPRLPTLVGGVHATLVPEQLVLNPNLDFICVGEGEAVVVELATALQQGRSPERIENLWLRHDDETIQNQLRPLLSDLDELPFPDRELFGFDEILAGNGGWVDLMAGRGCPYSCSYCSTPGLRTRFKGLGQYVRFRSVANVLGEIRALNAKYSISTLNFQDDVFTLDRDWVLQFSAAYRAEFEFPFWINSRVERILDEEVVATLAGAGCRGVRIGLESGNEDLRARVLKRRMSNDAIRQVFALAHQYGLDVYTCNMLGIPGETADMIDQTIALNRELEPAGMQFSVFYPYAMTELYEVCVKEGYLVEDSPLNGYYGRKSVLQLPTLSRAELERGYDRFEALQAELKMKRSSPSQYRAFRVLRTLCGGNEVAAQGIVRQLVHLKRVLKRMVCRVTGTRPSAVSVGEE